jgi:hypothetical protein
MLTPLTPSMARAFAAFTIPGTRTGLTFMERYLENLTAGELAGDLAAGLGVVFVGESRPPGWLPSALLGAEDGQREADKLSALSVPEGVTVTCDLEGMGGSAQDAIAYVIAWCQRKRRGDIGQGYIGDQVPLNPMQLYQLPFTRYQRSLSNVQQVAGVDYCMLQAFPTQTLKLLTGDLSVDLDFVTRDKRLRLPTMLIDDWKVPASAPLVGEESES